MNKVLFFQIVLFLIGIAATFYSASLEKEVAKRIAIIIGGLIIIVSLIWFGLRSEKLRKTTKQIMSLLLSYWQRLLIIIIFILMNILLFLSYQDLILIGAVTVYTVLLIFLSFQLLKERIIPQYLEFKESTFISAHESNHRSIPSDFILWDQCTILLWVYVSNDLKNAPNYRYLLSHQSNSPQEAIQLNLFALRYDGPDMQWQVVFTNNSGQHENNHLIIADQLDIGWHQFIIAWDQERESEKLVFCIDQCQKGSMISRDFLASWPQSTDKNLFIGAWKSPYNDSYCEAHLFKLSIFERYLSNNSVIVKRHFENRPGEPQT